MKRYLPEELVEVLRLHGMWWQNEDGGIRANLIRANLRDADLSDADLIRADLSGADLGGANLIRANLSSADLIRADLSGADLGGANLIRADLSGADLIRANLSGADLGGANLIRANLRGANLSDANLGGNLKVSTMRVFSGLYEYQCWAIVSDAGVPWARMGCLLKSIADWDAIGIRTSNLGEFPDDGSRKSERRARAFGYTRAEALVLAAEFVKKEK